MKFFLSLISIFSVTYLIGQTTLTQGDIAFIGLNFDGNDDMVFVLLKDVDASTSINFTDCGWDDGSSAFICNAGDVNGWTWTSGQNLSIGQTVTIQLISPLMASIGSVSGSVPVMSSIGDQIFAYQGNASSPTFIAGVHSNESSTNANWSGGTSNNQTSALPDILTNGVDAIRLHNSGTEVDNWQYNCAVTSGNVATVRSAINNVDNWSSDNNSAFSPADPNCSWSITLPIALISFEVKKEKVDRIKVLWTTATETNNDYFVIEKSQNLTEWRTVALVQGSGDSFSEKRYEIYDSDPLQGLSYYRLKQVDFDGQIENFAAKSIFYGDDSSQLLNIYPNPTSGWLNVERNTFGDEQIEIFNIFGQKVTSKNGQLYSTGKNYRVDLSDLPMGVYYLKIASKSYKVHKL